MMLSLLELINTTNLNTLSIKVKKDNNVLSYINMKTKDVFLNSISEKIYFVVNTLKDKPKCDCGNYVHFISFSKGYRQFCSTKCSRNSKETIQKTKKTILKRFGVENPSQSKQIKEKKIETTLKNYGVENPSQSKQIKEKRKKTNLKRFGVENPMQNVEIKEKMKATNIEQYGNIGFGFDRLRLKDVDWKKVKEKRMKTCLEKYDAKTPFHSKDIQLKIKQTNLRKYGIENQSYRYITNFNDYNKKKVILSKFMNDGYFDRTSYCKYFNVSTFAAFNKLQQLDIEYNNMPTTSLLEKELFNYVMTLYHDLKENDRSILQGKELDIYIPDKKMAIEFNGIYWHSELNGKNKHYHLDKTKLCNAKDIQLIHIFENEWIEKQNIIKSVIAAKLGFFKKRLYGRKCKIIEISNNDKNNFIKENHLQGVDKSSIKLGLFYEGMLVSIMTFGNSRYNKKYQYEMHRYCSKMGYQIIGGASKLWSYFINIYKPKSVITYADRRYSNGRLYEKLGFNKTHISPPNYFYFKNGSGLMSRLQFQKHKLKNKLIYFDSHLTEWDNMKKNNYDRIWDCGSFVYTWHINMGNKK